MKLYVVMKGEYSDRRILRIFMDKEKAINFCKYCDESYYNEYETNDDGYQMLKNGYHRCYIECTITKVAGKFETKIKHTEHHLISASEYETLYGNDKGKSVQVSRNEFPGENLSYYVDIHTFFRENDISEDKIDDVLRKIGYDTCSEVAALFAEGRKLKQIQEIYKQ